jgi:hypothetical protein
MDLSGLGEAGLGRARLGPARQGEVFNNPNKSKVHGWQGYTARLTGLLATKGGSLQEVAVRSASQSHTNWNATILYQRSLTLMN